MEWACSISDTALSMAAIPELALIAAAALNASSTSLKLMARYVRGDNFEIGGVDAKEWERDVDIGYTVQTGSLKGASLLWRNVAYRGSHTTDIDENRVILGYTFNLW